MVTCDSSQPPVKDTTLTFQCLILASTNYTIWRMCMEVLIGIYEVWDVVDPGSDDAKKNTIVKGLLFQSISKDLVLQIENLKTGKEIHARRSHVGAQASKKFLTSFLRRFVHIVAVLEQILDLKTTGFEDVVGRLKATEYFNGNNDSSGERGCGLYSRGRGHGCGRGNMQNQGQRDSSKTIKRMNKRVNNMINMTSHIYRHFVSKCLERNRNHEVNLNEAQEKGVYHEEGTFFMMNHNQETIFMNEEKYTPPNSELNTDDEDDVWYFDNSTSNHMTGLNISTEIMTQVEKEDVDYTLEVVDEVEVMDVVGETCKTKVNVTPRKP
nr:hypothetical protein [Tanacetum cinerariifolium]